MPQKRTFQRPYITIWHNTSDMLPQAAIMLDPYFNYATSHECVANWLGQNRSAPVKENCAYFYTRVTLPQPASKIYISCTSDEYDDEYFFDNQIEFDKSPIFKPDGIEIIIDGHFAGVYYPDVNVLFATDWVHNTYTLHMMEQIWDEVVQELGLKQLEPVVNPTPATPIMIGADPEFEIVNAYGEIISAEDVLMGRRTDTKIGTDGSGKQVEFRPAPAKHHNEMVRHFQQLLLQFHDEFKDFDLSPVGDTYPLGGHIHIGGIKDTDIILIYLLDTFMGDRAVELSGKARGDYRERCAWRGQPHGLEYRTPPAAFFSDPKIMEIVCKMVMSLTHKYCNYERIEVSTPPTKEEYMQYAGLTEDEVDYFLSFTPPPSLLAAWDIEVPPRKDPASKNNEPLTMIVFRDEWDMNVRERFEAALFPLLRKLHVYTLTLYGLAEHRGMVTTIPAQGIYETITHPMADSTTIGIPYRVRMGYESCEPLIQAITTHLTETFEEEEI